jgi:hypothetical protein
VGDCETGTLTTNGDRKRGYVAKRKNYAYLDCRAYGHAWTPIELEKEPSFGIAVDFMCQRCATHRRDIIARNGMLTSRFYSYPDNYKTAPTSRDTWRKEWLSNQVITQQKEKIRNG